MEKKTADRRSYMREYRQKKYAEEGEKIRNLNRAFYYKYKFNLSSEEMKL